MLRILPEVMNGTHSRMTDCTLGTFKNFELVSRQPLFIHLDGEIFATPEIKPVTTLSAGIMPDAIQVIC
jgi:diacylglycerol kinase family enzyme